MIIVPVEKKFDWSKAPVVLFSLVILNCLIFFLYQSKDDKKIMEALSQYEKTGYFEREWPVFQTFLTTKGKTQKLEVLKTQVDEGDTTEAAFELLINEDFFPYLRTYADKNFEYSFYSEWKFAREEINNKLASTSSLVYGLRADHFRWYTFVTHQFMHGSIMHLLGNMFFLVICGFAVEAAIGHWWFLGFYLLAGIAGGVSQIYFNAESTSPLIGASGAISGVMAMYLAVFRLQKIEFFYWLFFFVGYFRAPALLILPFYLGKEVYSYFHDTQSNVAFMAHAGGFTAGALLIGIAILLKPSVLNRTYIEAQGPSNDRQEQLAEIYEAIEKFRFDRALALVNQTIDSYGSNFELARLKYNLLKINRGPDYEDAVLKLLSYSLSAQGEIKIIDKVWRDNPDLQNHLKELEVLKLGIQLASLENPESAEQIFLKLRQSSCVNPAMSALATKLAKAFQNLRDQEKKSRYELMAQQYANPLTHKAALENEQGA